MQIRRIHLVNFRQHADTTLDFDRGLTGIVGPNGSGKTTVLEGIAWAMYGNKAARGERDSIRRRAAPPRSRVEVELDFNLGGHEYRVVRSLQSAALYQDGDAAAIANHPSAVTDKVTRLLGMSRDEFFNTYFTGQKELAIMASMSAPERARFLSRVLGYERLATAQTRLREERTAVKAALTTAESGLTDPELLALEEAQADERISRSARQQSDAEFERNRAQSVLADVRPRFEALEKRRQEVAAAETDLNIAEHRAVEARRAFETLDRDLAEALEAKTKRDGLLPALASWNELIATRDRLDREAQAYSERRSVEVNIAELSTQIRRADERIAVLPDEPQVALAKARHQEAQTRTAAAAEVLEQQRTVWVRDKQDAETKRKSLLDQHEDVNGQRSRLEAAGPTGICPTCGKPLGKEYTAVLDDLAAKLDEILFQGRFYRNRIDQLAKEPAELVAAKKAADATEAEQKRLAREIGGMEAKLGERATIVAARTEQATRLAAMQEWLAAAPPTYDAAAHQRVRDEVIALEPIRVDVVRLGAVAERAQLLVPKAALAEQELSRLEAKVTEIGARLGELGWSADAYESTKAALQRAVTVAQECEVALVKAIAEQDAAREHRASVARRREERDRRERDVARLRDDLTLNQELDRAFTDLRDDLNANLRPDLADTAATLLTDLTAGRYSDLELSEDYLPTIVDDGEPKSVISGGEEDLVNLALRLAISQMIADRAGQPFSLLVLDEIFGSLDEERRASVVDLLRSLADRFPQVILITHIESVRDGFDRMFRIDYDVERGVSTAREERVSKEAPDVAA
jgi:exonuclease SbcC